MTLSPFLLAVDLMPLFRGFVMVLFLISALLLTLVVLIQEGKGGGIAGAFGGAAAETFGVKAGSVNRFTALLATIFCGLALLHAGISSSLQERSVIAAPTPAEPLGLPGSESPMAEPAPMGESPMGEPAAMDGTTPPAMDGTTPPAMDGGTPPGTPATPGQPAPTPTPAPAPAPAPAPMDDSAPMDGSTPAPAPAPSPAPAPPPQNPPAPEQPAMN